MIIFSILNIVEKLFKIGWGIKKQNLKHYLSSRALEPEPKLLIMTPDMNCGSLT